MREEDERVQQEIAQAEAAEERENNRRLAAAEQARVKAEEDKRQRMRNYVDRT